MQLSTVKLLLAASLERPSTTLRCSHVGMPFGSKQLHFSSIVEHLSYALPNPMSNTVNQLAAVLAQPCSRRHGAGSEKLRGEHHQLLPMSGPGSAQTAEPVIIQLDVCCEGMKVDQEEARRGLKVDQEEATAPSKLGNHKVLQRPLTKAPLPRPRH